MEEREEDAVPSAEMLTCIRAVVEDILSRRNGHSTDTVVPPTIVIMTPGIRQRVSVLG